MRDIKVNPIRQLNRDLGDLLAEHHALLRVARAGNEMIEDVVPVPYKGYEVGREAFEKFVEAIKDAGHLLEQE